MALYEHTFLARQDISAQQVDALVERFSSCEIAHLQDDVAKCFDHAEPLRIRGYAIGSRTTTGISRSPART